MAGLLLEAKLPFSASLGPRALEGEAPLRCCRGLRAKTLAQRVACWRPFRRWLLANDHGPWPTTAALVLEYLAVVGGEGAARTTQSSLLSSLRFLEEAGEVPEGERLSQSPAVKNAVREGSGAGQPEREKKAGTGQAPPLLLAIIVALRRW